MRNEMSEAQRLTLQAAVVREDRFLQPPRNARGAAARTIAGKLIDAGWAKEMRAVSGAPIWRRDADSGTAFTLKLTTKGKKAVDGSNEESVGTRAGITCRRCRKGRAKKVFSAEGTSTRGGDWGTQRRHANGGRWSVLPQAPRGLEAR